MTSSTTFAQIASGLPNTWPGSAGAGVKSMSMVASSLSLGFIFVARATTYSVNIYVILSTGEFDISGGVVLSSESVNSNAGLFQIDVTKSDSSTNSLTCSSTAGLVVNTVIFFTSTSGTSFGGVITCATTCTRYYVHTVLSPTTFTISTAPSSIVPMSLASGTFSMIMDIVDHRAPMIPYAPDTILGFESDDRNFFAIASSKRNFYCRVTTCAVSTNIFTCDVNTNLAIGDSVLFSGPTFCGVLPETVYFVINVDTATTFKVSRTKGGTSHTIAGTVLTVLSMKISTVRKLLVYENVKNLGWHLASSLGSMLTIDEVTDMQLMQYHGRTLILVSRWRTGTLSKVMYSCFLQWNNKQSKFTISPRAYHNFDEGAKKVRILQPFINWRYSGEIYPHSSQSDAAFGSSLSVSLDSVVVGAPLFEDAAEYQISVTSSTTSVYNCLPTATCALDLVQNNPITFSFSSASFGGVKADIMYSSCFTCFLFRSWLLSVFFCHIATKFLEQLLRRFRT
jgi:hypothetical protein